MNDDFKASQKISLIDGAIGLGFAAYWVEIDFMNRSRSTQYFFKESFNISLVTSDELLMTVLTPAFKSSNSVETSQGC
jgi:hypothetical protein